VWAGAVPSGENGEGCQLAHYIHSGYITSVDRLYVRLQCACVVFIGTPCRAHSVRHFVLLLHIQPNAVRVCQPLPEG
jgi:hypothetical protein